MMRTAALLAAAACVAHAHDDQRYDHFEEINLFGDNLIPEANPSESYPFFDLAFCKPEHFIAKQQTLGEVLGGSRKVYLRNYHLHFGKGTPKQTVCTKTLTEEEVAAFREAILHSWSFTMYLDEIPMKAPVGMYDPTGEHIYLSTHYDFHFDYNGDRVIEAVLKQQQGEGRLLLPPTGPVEVTFTYTSQWSTSSVQFEDRPANNPKFIYEEEIDIQWFSIINSFVLVIFLTFFLAFITLRLLRKDFQRYSEEEDETGWKLIHADVFRFPSYVTLFTAMLGCGVQLLIIFIAMLSLSVVGVFYAHGRGTMYATIIVIYSQTAIVAGYVSGSWYKKLGGDQWVHNVLLTCSLFVVPVLLIWSILNSIAWAKGSTAALPAGTVLGLFALFFLVAFPLTLAGAIFGKNTTGDFDAPCRTKNVQRPIPAAPRWRGASYHVAVAGFLPFSAISVELYYVFMSLWGHQLFAPYSILFLMFGILLVVTACITVCLTYLQLSVEDHEWWWRSFFSGGATAFYMYAYIFYYWVVESQMYGVLQLSFYFGYMLIICYAVFLMLGTIGFFASMTFVSNIYASIKLD